MITATPTQGMEGGSASVGCLPINPNVRNAGKGRIVPGTSGKWCQPSAWRDSQLVEEEKMESKKLMEKSYGVDLAFNTSAILACPSIFQEFGDTIV